MKLSLRLLLLVLIAALPVLVIQVYERWEERERRKGEIAEEALRLARLAAAQQDQFIEGARYLLTAAAQLPEVRHREPAACSARMAEFRRRFATMTGIGVIGRNGMTFCTSGAAATTPVYLGDRDYVQRAIRTKSLAISGYIVGRATGEATLNFAYPALDDAGEVAAVIILAFNLDRLSASLFTTPPPSGTTMALVDRQGVLLARTPAAPDRIGERLPDGALADAVVAQHRGTIDAIGFDGVRRLYGFAPLLASGELSAVVGLPWQEMLREADRLFWREMALTGLAFLLAAILALVSGELWIRRPVAALQGVVGRVAGGDLAARARLGRHSSPELHALAGSVNAMAKALEAREAALRQSEERLRAVVETAADGIVIYDDRGTIEFANPAAERLFGYRREELIGRSIGRLMPPAPAGPSGDGARDGGGPAEAFGDGGGGGVRREATGRQRDGAMFPISLSIGGFELEGRPFFTAIVRDITERKRFEEHQRLLMAEVDHRAKNMLATVQAMVQLTRPRARSVDEYARNLDGRLRALARAHDLLARDRWEGTGLHDLIRDEFRAYGGGGGTFVVEGDDVLLRPPAAQTLSLVLHELTTNAAKYGALSVPGGRVTVTSSIDRGGVAAPANGAKLVLRWAESGGPEVAPPAHRGFGSMVIERSVAHQLEGAARLEFARSGVRCEVEVPLNGIATSSR